MELTRRSVLRAVGASGLAVLTTGAAVVTSQSPALAAPVAGWRWCHLCAGLWLSHRSARAVCPGNSGGLHGSEGSGNYNVLPAGDPGKGQTGWRFCRLCSGLWFNGHPAKGACPGNGGLAHRSDGGDYQLEPASVGGGQANWRWCHLCEGLWFNGNFTKGACPGNAGFPHHSDGSTDYQLRGM